MASAPDQLSRAACDELAARHGVAVKDSLFDVLGAGDGTVAKAAVVRFCQLDALAHGTCGGAAAAPKTPKAARKTAREVVRRTLLAKGASRLSKDKGSGRVSDSSVAGIGVAGKASLGAVGEGSGRVSNEGRARRGTLPKERDAPADVDGATVAPPQRRRTPSMYLGGAPRESESEKRLRESIRALGAETRIRMELDRATAKERRQKRLEALRVQAEQALASLEELPEVEKRRVRNQGILSLYTPENLTKREKIREDPRVENILGKWWAASLRYDDKDRDEGLNRGEYAAWHARLLALYAALGLDDDPLTDAEKNKILEEDFALDSGGAKVVDEEKFLHAVFQVADQWVEQIDAAQYAEFLERAYDVVYRELVDADAIKPPDSWLTHVKGKAHRPWDLSRTCDFAAEMYRLKLEGRGKPKVWGQTLSRFVLSHIKERFGPGNYRKQLSGFVQRILQVVEAPPEDPAIFAWLLLFAQLAGFHSRSSRLPALPPAAEQYVLDTLAASAELISEDSTYSLRACMSSPATKGLVGHVRADAAKKLLLALLKKAPFEDEPPEFAKAMESAFRSIVSSKSVGQAELLTLVAAGYVAASCPGVLRAD